MGALVEVVTWCAPVDMDCSCASTNVLYCTRWSACVGLDATPPMAAWQARKPCCVRRPSVLNQRPNQRWFDQWADACNRNRKPRLDETRFATTSRSCHRGFLRVLGHTCYQQVVSNSNSAATATSCMHIIRVHLYSGYYSYKNT
jgi:hypothetical protein